MFQHLRSPCSCEFPNREFGYPIGKSTFRCRLEKPLLSIGWKIGISLPSLPPRFCNTAFGGTGKTPSDFCAFGQREEFNFRHVSFLCHLQPCVSASWKGRQLLYICDPSVFPHPLLLLFKWLLSSPFGAFHLTMLSWWGCISPLSALTNLQLLPPPPPHIHHLPSFCFTHC